MPPADHTTALAEATRCRSERAGSDTEKAISAAQRTGGRTSLASIALAAGVSRSWLYPQPDLVTATRQLQDGGPPPSGPTCSPRRWVPSSDGWRPR